MKINLFDYALPDEQIAQFPTDKRDESKLLVIDRKTGMVYHKHFYDIIEYLNPGDSLVLNNSKVIHARLMGIKEKTGAAIEILIIKEKKNKKDTWEAMIRPAKRIKKGDKIVFSPNFYAVSQESIIDGIGVVEFFYKGIFMERLSELGKMPIPPYIRRQTDELDDSRYQTVYSEIPGSVAAPTAGLHFTENLLRKIKEKGIETVYVTLHVGLGTFMPVKTEDTDNHKMHEEFFSVSDESAHIINRTKKNGNKVICVGTTSVRTIESISDENGVIRSGSGKTDIFISPGYNFKAVDNLITNFHLPKSTLIMLVSAFYDRKKILDVYDEAIKNNYRFFSYGDSMLII